MEANPGPPPPPSKSKGYGEEPCLLWLLVREGDGERSVTVRLSPRGELTSTLGPVAVADSGVGVVA